MKQTNDREEFDKKFGKFYNLEKEDGQELLLTSKNEVRFSIDVTDDVYAWYLKKIEELKKKHADDLVRAYQKGMIGDEKGLNDLVNNL